MKLTLKSAHLYKRLARHFGNDPAGLPVVQEEFDIYQRPNLHFALNELFGNRSCKSELLGIIDFDYEVGLARLSRESGAGNFEIGPVEYMDVPLANGARLACIKQGLYLFSSDAGIGAMLIADRKHAYPPKIRVEVMAARRELAEQFLRGLVDKSSRGIAYKGHVLSLELDCFGSISVRFHNLPQIHREDIILPESVLRRIERQTIDFGRHIERLRQARRHIKRGILLHGPPGTGKTLCAMYLAAQMPQRTTMLMTGMGMRSMETACGLARMLQPATVILEDVDLIGAMREHQMVDANAILFELLNQMDGLADDADILFILTTNRPDILEPALASRPGRIDQAIEIPLPDEDCRRRLFELYGRGLQMELRDGNRLVERTAGASAAFIRELLRKACVLAAVQSDREQIVVRDEHLDEAIAELVVAGGELTKSLLGAPKVGKAP